MLPLGKKFLKSQVLPIAKRSLRAFGVDAAQITRSYRIFNLRLDKRILQIQEPLMGRPEVRSIANVCQTTPDTALVTPA